MIIGFSILMLTDYKDGVESNFLEMALSYAGGEYTAMIGLLMTLISTYQKVILSLEYDISY